MLSPFRRIYRQLTHDRRRQLLAVLALMLVGAVLEVMTLGAVVPFLAIVSSPDRANAVIARLGIGSSLSLDSVDDFFFVFSGAFIVIAITSAIVRTSLVRLSNNFVFGVGGDIAEKIFSKLLHQPYALHLQRNSSESVAVVNEVLLLTRHVMQPLMQATIASIIGIFIIAALLVVNPLMTGVAFVGFGIVYYTIASFSRHRLDRNSRSLKRLQHKRIQSVQEALGGIRDILLDNVQPVFERRFTADYRAFTRANAMNVFLGQAPRYAAETAGIVLVTSFAMVLHGQPGGILNALPTLGAIVLGAQRLLPLAQQLYAAVTLLRGNKHVADHVLDHAEMAVADEFILPPPTEALPFTREIRLDHVTFRYRDDLKPVLRDVNIAIPRGARVGILGQTGSGKSTLIDLIMGLQQCSEGAVRIDGVALGHENRRAWHLSIAHVPQVIFLADTSVAENIAFGVDPAAIDMDRLRDAAKRAHIDEFVMGLPQGYDTTIGERGSQISGGQRQRVGIARALYKQASVLVLDEATSALDSRTENEIMASINDLSRDLTVIIVAHRLSTLEKCDMWIEASGGSLALRDTVPQA